MTLDNIGQDELQKFVTELDQTIYNHQQWYNALVRIMICQLPSDKHDISEDSYKECRFGQWYYSVTSNEIHNHPGFKSIGEEHCRMHQLARHLLLEIEHGNRITTIDFDNFANGLDRLRLEIFALKHEIEDLLYKRDPLTRAISRVNMLPILRDQHEMTKRGIMSSCIAMMDLDNFKKINDVYGHPAGDTVLAAIIHYIIDHIRSYDKVFRYGGEEFIICIQNTNLIDSEKIIEGLRKGLSELKINIGQKEPISINASFGLTLLDPAISIEEAIEHADKALYEAKAAGRNCVRIWREEKGA